MHTPVAQRGSNPPRQVKTVCSSSDCHLYLKRLLRGALPGSPPMHPLPAAPLPWKWSPIVPCPTKDLRRTHRPAEEQIPVKELG